MLNASYIKSRDGPHTPNQMHTCISINFGPGHQKQGGTIACITKGQEREVTALPTAA